MGTVYFNTDTGTMYIELVGGAYIHINGKTDIIKGKLRRIEGHFKAREEFSAELEAANGHHMRINSKDVQRLYYTDNYCHSNGFNAIKITFFEEKEEKLTQTVYVCKICKRLVESADNSITIKDLAFVCEECKPKFSAALIGISSETMRVAEEYAVDTFTRKPDISRILLT